MQGAGLLIGGVFVDADAVALAIAGRLEHHLAVLFHKGDKFLRRGGGGVDPLARQILAKKHVEQHLVARHGGVAGLVVVDPANDAVAALVGEIGIALGAVLFVELEEEVFGDVAARLLARGEIVLKTRACRHGALLGLLLRKLRHAFLHDLAMAMAFAAHMYEMAHLLDELEQSGSLHFPGRKRRQCPRHVTECSWYYK